MRKFIILGVMSGIGLLQMTGTARAEVQQMVVRVDGLSCPFCAYGLQKRLATLRAIESLRVELKANRAVIRPRQGKLIPAGELNKAVKAAGFTPRGVQLTVSGKLTRAGEAVQLQASGTDEVFTLSGSEAEKLGHQAGIGDKTVTVSGSLQDTSPLPTVVVESFQLK